MQSIYKYPIETMYSQTVWMPSGAEILCVQVQRGIPCLWAKVDLEARLPYANRLIFVFGTGQEFPDSGHRYIGTYQLHDGDFIGHVFEAT